MTRHGADTVSDMYIRGYEDGEDIDEWCKLHEEILKDIRTEAYRSGYHDGAKAEWKKTLEKFSDLIHNESVRFSPTMVDMVYSYRVAQIIAELRKDERFEYE